MGAEGQAFADMVDYKTLLRNVDLSNASTMAEAQNILETTLVSNLLSGWQSYVNSKAGARSVDAANVAEFLNWQGSQEIQTINDLIAAWNEFYRMKIAAVEQTRKSADNGDTVCSAVCCGYMACIDYCGML